MTTIIKDSDLNTGLNPVSELLYGLNVSRILVHFDHKELKEMVDDKIFPNIQKFRHYLKITNSGSIDASKMNCGILSSIDDNVKIRTTSFDLIFFLIPQEWDNGRGFDFARTFFNKEYYAKDCSGIFTEAQRLISTQSSNWYQARNGYPWKEEGIYSNLTLSKEYDNFSSEEGSSIIIGRQHFDIGNEDINLDITDIVNSFIKGELENYGIGIAYSPMLEASDSNIENYVGFLTPKTNTFFEPYLETIYCDNISDDRANFILDKNNKLYLYCNIGGNPTNLDELPKCHVNDVEYEVKQYSKGIYYIDINLSKCNFKPNTMLYDVWSNIIYQGERLDDIELDFVLKSSNNFYNIGVNQRDVPNYVPSVYGIGGGEDIYRNGEVRKVNILARVPYTNNRCELIDEMYYRLYIKDGEREITVIPYMKCEKTFLENYFMLDCEMLIPQKYYLDVRIKYNGETRTHKNILEFNIVNSLNNKYI